MLTEPSDNILCILIRPIQSRLYAFQTGGVLDPTGAVEEYRFMLITDKTVTGGKGVSAEKDILSRLTEAGVDVNNYYEVMDYFGLKY